MELKNALAAWKKAKPLMLTKTGVSEALRELPAEPKTAAEFQKALAALSRVMLTLKAAEVNKHIQKEAKAIACVKEIVAELNKTYKAWKAEEVKVQAAEKLKAEQERQEQLTKASANIWAKAYPIMKKIQTDLAAFLSNRTPANILVFKKSCEALLPLKSSLPNNHPVMGSIKAISYFIGESAEFVKYVQKGGNVMEWVIEKSQPFNMLALKLKKLDKNGPALDLTK